MGRKKAKLTKLSEADEKKLGELSLKERSVASYGKPDFTDVENLRAIFMEYDKATGGKLLRCFKTNDAMLKLKKNIKPIETAEHWTYSFPDRDLQEYVQTYFPTIWTDNEHARWFLKWFPGFRSG